jgi:hypothetical protein
MKKIIFSIIAIISGVLASCTKNEVKSDNFIFHQSVFSSINTLATAD